MALVNVFCLGGADHGDALVHDGHIGLNQLSQRSPDGAAVDTAHLAQNLLDDGVHIAVGGAHLVDDAAAFILDLQSGGQIALLHQIEQLHIQAGHDTVGAADAAGGAHHQTGNQLLIGAVEDDGALVTPHLDVLGRHGGVLDADAAGILQHFLQQRHGQGNTGQLGNVVDDEVGVGSGCGNVIPVLGNGIGGAA